jgi:hypothetical protein
MPPLGDGVRWCGRGREGDRLRDDWGEGGAGVWVMSRVISGSTPTKYGILRIRPGWSLPRFRSRSRSYPTRDPSRTRIFPKNENGWVKCRKRSGSGWDFTRPF